MRRASGPVLMLRAAIGFEMSLIVVEAIRRRCASFMILTATVSEIFGGQTNSFILVVQWYLPWATPS